MTLHHRTHAHLPTPGWTFSFDVRIGLFANTVWLRGCVSEYVRASGVGRLWQTTVSLNSLRQMKMETLFRVCVFFLQRTIQFRDCFSPDSANFYHSGSFVHCHISLTRVNKIFWRLCCICLRWDSTRISNHLSLEMPVEKSLNLNEKKRCSWN